MNRFTLIAAAAALMLAPQAADAQDADPMAPIARLMAAFNVGDVAGIASVHADEVVIVDELPPFAWRGREALAGWLADLSADYARRGVTDGVVTLGAVRRRMVHEDRAYVVMDVVFRYRERGVATVEPAVMAFTLRRGSDGWRISGWTWGGTEPRPEQAGS
jgi:ketosteroid isomerase-like protein